jgi:hypothetical protein
MRTGAKSYEIRGAAQRVRKAEIVEKSGFFALQGRFWPVAAGVSLFYSGRRRP